jgi:hypothetical protein
MKKDEDLVIKAIENRGSFMRQINPDFTDCLEIVAKEVEYNGCQLK